MYIYDLRLRLYLLTFLCNRYVYGNRKTCVGWKKTLFGLYMSFFKQFATV